MKIQHPEFVFDTDKLLKDYYNIKKEAPNQDQINIVSYKNTDSLSIGTGSMYDHNKKKFVVDHTEFNKILPNYKDTYTEKVCNYIKKTVKGVKIGRIRWMLLKPKSTLSYHRDPKDLLRFHIPLITTENAFFIVEDVIYRMQDPGCLYAINTMKRHTAVNTANTERLHMVFDTWENENE